MFNFLFIYYYFFFFFCCIGNTLMISSLNSTTKSLFESMLTRCQRGLGPVIEVLAEDKGVFRFRHPFFLPIHSHKKTQHQFNLFGMLTTKHPQSCGLLP